MRKRSSSAGAKKAKRTSAAAKRASSKKKAKPAAKKAKKVKKALARKPTRAASKKTLKRAAPKKTAAKKKVKRAAPKKAAARKTTARKKTVARKAATRKVAAKKKLKKVARPAARKAARAGKAKKKVRKTTRRVASKAAKRTTGRGKPTSRKAKAPKKVTRATARKSATRAKATRKVRAAAPSRAKKAVRSAKKSAARKAALDARARRKLALAERKAAAKERAREAARKKLEKKLALKAKKEAAAAKKLARKLAAKEAKARAMEAVRARRAKLAEAKARKKAAEAEAREAAKKQAKEAAAAAKAEAKAAKANKANLAKSEPPARAAGGDQPLRVGTSRSKLLHGDDRKSKAGTSAPPGAGQKAGKKGDATPPSGRSRPPVMRPVLPTIPIEPPKPTLEERAAQVSQRLESSQNEEVRKEYEDRLYMSWIHHDSALEGVVYSFHELQIAIDPAITVVPDSSMQPVCDEIRRHKQALDFVRDAATKKRQPVTTDIIKRIYLILHPEEGDLKTVKYRKDIPQHRLYFHEYAPPDKIAYLVRQVVEWVNDPETRRTRTTLRIAARAHYDLLRAFPFPNDSGKVARLFMNFLLLRAGYPPAIIHSTERQRYYEALKGSPLAIVHMVQEALENSIASIDKFLDERTTRVRSFVS